MVGVRARVRAEMIEEIKAGARAQLASDGANLSLRAIARDMGMASSAIYRYFASRDELLTALIIDAYNALGDAVEKADAAIGRTDFGGRWRAIASAVRDWARAKPSEYLLIYGTPVPGYQAPQDTIGPAARAVFTFIAVMQDAIAAGAVKSLDQSPPDSVAEDLRRSLGAGASPEAVDVFATGVSIWLQLFGHISFELTGQLHNTISDYDAFFAYEIAKGAQRLGLA